MYLRSASLLAKISQALLQSRYVHIAQCLSRQNRDHFNSCSCIANRLFSSSTKGEVIRCCYVAKSKFELFVLAALDKSLEAPAPPPQLLSKLFPQTSGQTDDDDKKKEEQRRKDEDDKKEQENAWKRMKLGWLLQGTTDDDAVSQQLKFSFSADSTCSVLVS